MQDEIIEYDIYQVRNPLSRDWTTFWNKKPYRILANGTLLLPVFIAEKLAYELAEQVVQASKGIEAIVNKSLMREETAKLLSLAQSAQAGEEAESKLDRQITTLNKGYNPTDLNSVNPDSLSIIEPDEPKRTVSKDTLNPNALPTTTEVDTDYEAEIDTTVEPDEDFADLKSESEDLIENQKTSLMLNKRDALVKIATDLKIELDFEDPGVTKSVIADAIIAKTNNGETTPVE